MIRGRTMLAIKIIAMMYVAINNIFSEPRLFALPVSETSPPPNALPTFASPRCRRTAMISRTALATWIACVINTKLIQ